MLLLLYAFKWKVSAKVSKTVKSINENRSTCMHVEKKRQQPNAIEKYTRSYECDVRKINLCSTSNLNCHLFALCVHARARVDKLHTINEAVRCLCCLNCCFFVRRVCVCVLLLFLYHHQRVVAALLLMLILHHHPLWLANMERTFYSFCGWISQLFRLVVFAILIENNYMYAPAYTWCFVLEMHQWRVEQCNMLICQ